MINATNVSKTVQSTQKTNGLTAGILTPKTHIEACADLRLNLPFFLCAGRKMYLKQLPNELLIAISEHMENNHVALDYLNKTHQNYYDKLNAYIYCMWGFADGSSDFKFINGKWKLSSPENFNCNNSKCNCSKWVGKETRINGQILSKSQAFIIQQISKGLPDKAISANMNIAQSTYDYHKKNLLNLMGVQTREDLRVIALYNGIK